MKNQMGNNNVSGLQEEEKSSAVEAQEKITQEPVHEGDLKVEADEKVEELSDLSPDDQRSGANDSHGQNVTSNGKATENENTEEVGMRDLVAQVTEINDTEEEQTEDLVVQTTDTKSEPLVQPLEVPTESSGEASPVDESQTAPSSKLSSDSEKLLELNLEKHALVASDPKILQLCVGRETEEVEGSNSVSNANFTSSDVLHPKPDDQHEPVVSQDEPQGEYLGVIERAGELLELNLSNHKQDKVPLIGDRTAEHHDVSLVSDTGIQDMGRKTNDAVVEGNISKEGSFLETISTDEEKLEQLWVHVDEKGSTAGETEPVLSSDLRDNGEKRVDSSQEVSEPQDKSIVLTEESKGTGKESENEEGICDSIASQPEKLKTSFDYERIAKENASDSNSSPEMKNASQIKDDKVNNGASLVGNSAHYVSEKFEDVMENAPEVRTALTDLTVIEPTQKQENSTGGLGRISIETNEETTRNQVDLRRSPSFDFDLSLGARYEDSDQTPLLCHDKAASRSISSRDVLTFQTTTSNNQYGRDQAVEVEEKTIRMERSDSDKPRAPFMNLLRKEGNANAFVELKKEEAPLTEQAMSNSTRGSGKRRPLASLFSTCICCAASVP